MEVAGVESSVAGDVGVGEIWKTPCWRFCILHFVAREAAAKAGRAVRNTKKKASEECGNISICQPSTTAQRTSGEQVRRGGVVQAANSCEAGAFAQAPLPNHSVFGTIGWFSQLSATKRVAESCRTVGRDSARAEQRTTRPGQAKVRR